MTLIEIDAVDDPFDSLIERRVVEDDVRGLPAELERETFAGAGERALDRLPHLGRAGERDLVDAGVRHDLRPGPSVAGDDVHDTRRQLGLSQYVAEQECRERSRLRGLEHDGVP